MWVRDLVLHVVDGGGVGGVRGGRDRDRVVVQLEGVCEKRVKEWYRVDRWSSILSDSRSFVENVIELSAVREKKRKG